MKWRRGFLSENIEYPFLVSEDGLWLVTHGSEDVRDVHVLPTYWGEMNAELNDGWAIDEFHALSSAEKSASKCWRLFEVLKAGKYDEMISNWSQRFQATISG